MVPAPQGSFNHFVSVLLSTLWSPWIQTTWKSLTSVIASVRAPVTTTRCCFHRPKVLPLIGCCFYRSQSASFEPQRCLIPPRSGEQGFLPPRPADDAAAALCSFSKLNVQSTLCRVYLVNKTDWVPALRNLAVQFKGQTSSKSVHRSQQNDHLWEVLCRRNNVL